MILLIRRLMMVGKKIGTIRMNGIAWFGTVFVNASWKCVGVLDRNWDQDSNVT